jgi:hypothetical protein
MKVQSSEPSNDILLHIYHCNIPMKKPDEEITLVVVASLAAIDPSLLFTVHVIFLHID